MLVPFKGVLGVLLLGRVLLAFSRFVSFAGHCRDSSRNWLIYLGNRVSRRMTLILLAVADGIANLAPDTGKLQPGFRHWGPVERMVGRRLSLFPFSPSAFRATLQTSVLQASNRITGAAMSLIKRADVKNHISARHRTEIHLAPGSQPDAAGLLRNLGDDSKATDSVEDSPRIPSPGGPDPAPTSTTSGQSKSVKA
jgi:hypothetical protein